MDYREYEIFKKENEKRKKRFESIFGLGTKHLYKGKEVIIIGFDKNTNYEDTNISPMTIGGEIIGNYPLVLVTCDEENSWTVKDSEYVSKILGGYENSHCQWARITELNPIG